MNASALMKLEEELIFWGIHPDVQAATGELQRLLESVVAAMHKSDTRARNLAAWVARALPRLPERVQRSGTAQALALAASALVAAPGSFAQAAPPLAARRLVHRFVDKGQRVSVAVRRISDVLEFKHGRAWDEWQTFEVSAPPIVYVGRIREPVVVPAEGVARVEVIDDDVELRDADGRGFSLSPRLALATLRQSIARLETIHGASTAFLIGPALAATSVSAVGDLPPDEDVRLYFPGVSVNGWVRAIADRIALVQLDQPLTRSGLPFANSFGVGDVWRAVGPGPQSEPAFWSGQIAEATDDAVVLAYEYPPRDDASGAPVFLGSDVLGVLCPHSLGRTHAVLSGKVSDLRSRSERKAQLAANVVTLERADGERFAGLMLNASDCRTDADAVGLAPTQPFSVVITSHGQTRAATVTSLLKAGGAVVLQLPTLERVYGPRQEAEIEFRPLARLQAYVRTGRARVEEVELEVTSGPDRDGLYTFTTPAPDLDVLLPGAPVLADGYIAGFLARSASDPSALVLRSLKRVEQAAVLEAQSRATVQEVPPDRVAFVVTGIDPAVLAHAGQMLKPSRHEKYWQRTYQGRTGPWQLNFLLSGIGDAWTTDGLPISVELGAATAVESTRLSFGAGSTFMFANAQRVDNAERACERVARRYPLRVQYASRRRVERGSRAEDLLRFGGLFVVSHPRHGEHEVAAAQRAMRVVYDVLDEIGGPMDDDLISVAVGCSGFRLEPGMLVATLRKLFGSGPEIHLFGGDPWIRIDELHEGTSIAELLVPEAAFKSVRERILRHEAVAAEGMRILWATRLERGGAEDPHKGAFGGLPARGTRELYARFERNQNGRFDTTLTVRSLIDESPLRGSVTFHLHPTFGGEPRVVDVSDGKATLLLRSYGPSTVGVEADGGETRLEIDLGDLPRPPEPALTR
jgi:hypothetical protein